MERQSFSLKEKKGDVSNELEMEDSRCLGEAWAMPALRPSI